MSQLVVRLRLLGVLALMACGSGSGLVAGTDATAPDVNRSDGAASEEAPSDAADWTFVRPLCGYYDSGAGCPGAAAATLSNPHVAGRDGGTISVGQDATVSVLLSAPTQAIDYPCVGFAADDPGVSFAPGDGGGVTDPELLGAYALLKGTSSRVSMPVYFASSIPHGTIVHFAAWVDSLNSGCANGALLEWDVMVP